MDFAAFTAKYLDAKKRIHYNAVNNDAAEPIASNIFGFISLQGKDVNK